jgi:hypothetical protein
MLSEALSPYFFKVVKGLMNFRHFLTETILTPGEFSLSQSGVQQTHFLGCSVRDCIHFQSSDLIRSVFVVWL